MFDITAPSCGTQPLEALVGKARRSHLVQDQKENGIEEKEHVEGKRRTCDMMAANTTVPRSCRKVQYICSHSFLLTVPSQIRGALPLR